MTDMAVRGISKKYTSGGSTPLLGFVPVVFVILVVKDTKERVTGQFP